MKTKRTRNIPAANISTQWDVMSGVPCIAGTRLPVNIIAGRFTSGESVDEIADDYRITPAHIEAAIRYELLRLRRRISWKSVRAPEARRRIEAARNAWKRQPANR